MQPTYFTELMLTEFTEFRGKQVPELTWFLAAISKLAISLPLVTYRGEFISCLSKYLYKIERTCSGLPQVMGLSSLDVFASWYLCNHFRISGGCSEWR